MLLRFEKSCAILTGGIKTNCRKHNLFCSHYKVESLFKLKTCNKNNQQWGQKRRNFAH